VPDDDFDRLGRQLRAGAGQLAGDLSPRPAALIRARGEQRRRRRVAGTLALALVLIAGGGGTAYAVGQLGPNPARPLAPATTGTATPSATPAHTATPPASATISPGSTGSPAATTSPGGTISPGHAAGATTLQLGPLTLRVPATWRVTYRDAYGDYTVSTGSCAVDELMGAEGGSACPSFSLIANAGTSGEPAGTSYRLGLVFTMSTGGTGCPARATNAGWFRETPGTRLSSGYAPVTTAKTADYTVWQIGCLPDDHPPPAFYFQQRDWYLPESDILIVDEYSTPGLAQILATATWAG
jgi:hypothetical protein